MALVLLGASTSRSPALAAESEPRISVSAQQAGAPVGFFELDGSAGSALGGNEVLVRNGGNAPVKVAVEAVDAETAANLGFAYEDRDLATDGPTTWIDVGPKTLTVPPGKVRPIPVMVRIPDDADPGDYLSGISVEALGQKEEAELQDGVALGSTHRYTIGAMVTVLGARSAQIELTGASVAREPGGVTFFLNARNTGNVLLREVTGEIEVSLEGKRIADAKLGPGTFVTGTSFSYPLLATAEEPAEGTEYRVRAKLFYGDEVAELDENVVFGQASAQRQEEFGGPPAGNGLPIWMVLAAVAALILLALTVIFVRRRRTRWAPLGPEAARHRLAHEVAMARAAGRPVSVIHLTPDRAGGDLLWPVLVAILPRIRPRDSVCHLGAGEVMIIFPDLAAAGAAGMAAELERLLATTARLRELGVHVRATSSEIQEGGCDPLASAVPPHATAAAPA